MCSFAIQALYPRAHQRLRNRLSQSMADCYVWIRYRKSCQSILQTRRLCLSDGLFIIYEELLGEEVSSLSQELAGTPAPGDNEYVPKATPDPKVGAASQSDLTSVNDTKMGRSLRHSRNTAQWSRTSSILANQANYPRPPCWDGKAMCEWCTAPLAKEDLSLRMWR